MCGVSGLLKGIGPIDSPNGLDGVAMASPEEHGDSEGKDSKDGGQGSPSLLDAVDAGKANGEGSVQVEVPHIQLTPVSNCGSVTPAKIPVSSEDVGATLSPATYLTPVSVSAVVFPVCSGHVSGSPTIPDSPVESGDRSVKQKPKTRSWRRKSDEELQTDQMSPPRVEAMDVSEGCDRRLNGVRRSLPEDVPEALIMHVDNTGPEGPKKKIKKMESLAPASKAMGKKKLVKR